MKKILLLLLIAFTAKISHAQFKPVEQGSTLKFVIKNLGFNVDGSFGGFEGNINFDAQNPAGSSFDVTINAASVNTENSLRDEHLKGDNYFDVKNHPRIHLVSAKISLLKSNTYQFNGQLTIKGKTKPVSFPFTAIPQGDGYLFKGSFKMNRKYFGIGGTSTISDELEVMLDVATKKVNAI